MTTQRVYELTIHFDGKPSYTNGGDSLGKLIEEVWMHFEDFENDIVPVQCGYTKESQMVTWRIDIGGDFPKEVFPLRDSEHPLVSAEIRKVSRISATTYRLAHDVYVPNGCWIWAAICDDLVVDFRGAVDTDDVIELAQTKFAMKAALQDKGIVKLGIVYGGLFEPFGKYAQRLKRRYPFSKEIQQTIES